MRGAMNTTSTAVVKLSIEVITLRVGDVERALRFYVDQVGTEVSHPGSTPRAGTTPASPTSRTRMATAGCCRNAATAIRDVAA
jgi:hypothetical protein